MLTAAETRRQIKDELDVIIARSKQPRRDCAVFESGKWFYAQFRGGNITHDEAIELQRQLLDALKLEIVWGVDSQTHYSRLDFKPKKAEPPSAKTVPQNPRSVDKGTTRYSEIYKREHPYSGTGLRGRPRGSKNKTSRV